MGKIRSEIDDAARKFIEAQHVFFVASAPLDAAGHVNLSPKGLDTFRILGPTTVAYVDFNGSGVETIALLSGLLKSQIATPAAMPRPMRRMKKTSAESVV